MQKPAAGSHRCKERQCRSVTLDLGASAIRRSAEGQRKGLRQEPEISEEPMFRPASFFVICDYAEIPRDARCRTQRDEACSSLRCIFRRNDRG